MIKKPRKMNGFRKTMNDSKWHNSHSTYTSTVRPKLLSTVVIRQLRTEFKFPTKIETAFSQLLAIR